MAGGRSGMSGKRTAEQYRKVPDDLRAHIVAGLATALDWHTTVLWLTPALVLCSVVAAVATWRDPTRVAAGGALAWATVVAVWTQGTPSHWTVERIEVTWLGAPSVQAALLVGSVAAVGVCAMRRDVRPGWRTA